MEDGVAGLFVDSATGGGRGGRLLRPACAGLAMTEGDVWFVLTFLRALLF